MILRLPHFITRALPLDPIEAMPQIPIAFAMKAKIPFFFVTTASLSNMPMFVKTAVNFYSASA